MKKKTDITWIGKVKTHEIDELMACECCRKLFLADDLGEYVETGSEESTQPVYHYLCEKCFDGLE